MTGETSPNFGTNDVLANNGIRALERGNVRFANRFASKLSTTPPNERVDLLRAATAVFIGKNPSPENTPSESPIEFSEPVAQLVAKSMIGMRRRDDTFRGIIGSKQREEQFTRGLEYLVGFEARGDDPHVPTELYSLTQPDIPPSKQVLVLEDYAKLPHQQRKDRIGHLQDKLWH